MSSIFITITGQRYYLGLKPFKVGRVIKLVKEPENDYDSEAIRAELPFIDTIGYVANSANTVYEGTYSAGRLYDKIGSCAYARIMFVTHSSAIAEILSPEEVEGRYKEKDVFAKPAKSKRLKIKRDCYKF